MEPNRCRLSAYGDAIKSLNAPIFCAAYRDARIPVITLHTTDGRDAARWRDEVTERLARDGVRARCKVKRHAPERLERARSLEALLDAVAGPKIVFDPTGALLRMRRLVGFAGRLRETFGPRLVGVYLEAWQRGLYLVFDPKAFADDGDIDSGAIETAQATVEAMLAGAADDGLDEIFATVMLGFGHPGLALVPVDRASPAGEQRFEAAMRKLRRGSMGTMLAAVFGTGLGSAAMAQDLPAVSKFNYSLSGAGGWTKNRGTSRVEGIATVPLGHRFGAQVDLNIGNEGDRLRWGVTGYAFWRDPSIGLAGIVSSWQQRGAYTVGRSGFQGELYVYDFTVGARLGAQYGRARDGFFGQFEVRWYPIDDLKLAAGADFAPGQANMAHFGIEYQPAMSSLPGLAFFADGGVGTRNYYRALMGVRYYFGDVKSLKRRHREDDPMPFTGNESQVLNPDAPPTTVPQGTTYVPPT
ncbi:MAG: hypothetical protein KIT16_06165 [Rhodospirillaceae bacterium]|nr:hypothetical protein [Rhodospirillaceae bacterium]